MDITNFVTWFVNLFIDILSYCFNTLNSITFYNISLLQFIITILVLSVVVTLLFTAAPISSINTSYNIGYSRGKSINAKKRKEKKGK